MVQEQKVRSVAQIAESLEQAAAMVFVDFRGLTVAEANTLRQQCREAHVRFQVVKNRLAKRAFDQQGLAPPASVLRGPTALAVGREEPTAPARVLAEFSKDCEHLVVKGGFLGERWLDEAAVKQLAAVPPRDQLLGRLAADLKSPLMKLARVLKVSMTQLSVALKAVAEQKST